MVFILKKYLKTSTYRSAKTGKRAPTNSSQSSKFTTGFSIIAQNDARLTQYSWTKNVTLFLYSFIGATTISLKQNQIVEVNGVREVPFVQKLVLSK